MDLDDQKIHWNLVFNCYKDCISLCEVLSALLWATLILDLIRKDFHCLGYADDLINGFLKLWQNVCPKCGSQVM